METTGEIWCRLYTRSALSKQIFLCWWEHYILKVNNRSNIAQNLISIQLRSHIYLMVTTVDPTVVGDIVILKLTFCNSCTLVIKNKILFLGGTCLSL